MLSRIKVLCIKFIIRIKNIHQRIMLITIVYIDKYCILILNSMRKKKCKTIWRRAHYLKKNECILGIISSRSPIAYGIVRVYIIVFGTYFANGTLFRRYQKINQQWLIKLSTERTPCAICRQDYFITGGTIYTHPSLPPSLRLGIL